VRRLFLTYWWVWSLLAALAVVGNELADRVLFDQHHAGGDLVIALAVVAIVFLASYSVVRRRKLRSG